MSTGDGLAVLGVCLMVGMVVGGQLLGSGIANIHRIQYGLSSLAHSVHTWAMEYRDKGEVKTRE